MKPHATLLACLLPLLAAPNIAQERAATAKTAAASFQLPAGEFSLSDLIDRSAAYLDCNILAAPTELQGAASFRLQKAIDTDRDGCLDLLTNMLYRSNLVLTVLDDNLDIYEVINTTGVRGREVMGRAQQRTVEQVLARPQRKLPVTTTVPLEHINAVIACNALRPFFASTVGGGGGSSLTIGNVGNVSSLLLSGLQDQVAQAIHLLQATDVAPVEEQHEPSVAERIATLEARLAELEKKLVARADPGAADAGKTGNKER